MQVTTVKTHAFTDQRPGTAGLRRKVSVFRQAHYLENFLQCVLHEADLPADARIVIGGDGRFFNDAAIRTAIAVLAGNGIRDIIVGHNGLLSTPAASHLIRASGAAGGLLFTASHNPAGPEGDFGIKYNTASGGQAPESLTERIHRRSLTISEYRIAQLPELPLARIGQHEIDGLRLQVVDPVDDYATLMQGLFDFDRISALLRGGRFRLCFDAMNAVTGPYARRILERTLGAPPGSVVRAEPLADFGGLHPDPNPVDAADLVDLMAGSEAPDFAAASDGDGDRNMILGRGCMVHPCDSLAVLAALHGHIPGYRGGLAGVARSMPTSRAIDRVAAAQGIDCHVTPTGWRFFCNLLEADMITLCGEESFGTSSSHAREKDGLWAVLFWLDLLAATGESVSALLSAHWRTFGRDHYLRQDYFIADTDQAQALVDGLSHACREMPGAWRKAGVRAASEFDYTDPVDGSQSCAQGIEVHVGADARIVFRLSGTGTQGATLRVYLERATQDAALIPQPSQSVVEPLARLARELSRIEYFTRLTRPSYSI
ncbi:MAG: alpha-D-glucose phosphate-specific phosphoglucomutase [Gammaproteobacteria bacterium]|nr:alpha-D-glucose phosphate-specific phosphoglucomutase [Gammaproteobacteria bacterium]